MLRMFLAWAEFVPVGSEEGEGMMEHSTAVLSAGLSLSLRKLFYRGSSKYMPSCLMNVSSVSF